MAYLAPTSDFVTSTLSGAIAAGDATATIGTGLDLPATNGILQIDYDSTTAVGADNGPETIAYATYTSGTGALAGMTRGLNGTTGVAHANGAKVQAGMSIEYLGAGSPILAAVYPVGSIYINAGVSTNPATLFGFGTWTAFGAGRVMVGLNGADTDFDTVEETGGAKTKTLTTAELPAHKHTAYGNVISYTAGGSTARELTSSPGSNNVDTSTTAAASAFSVMNPYIVVYMWKRTA